MKDKRSLNFGILFFLIILVGCQSKRDNKMPNFDKTIDNHFSAIKNRDIESLLKTVDRKKITLILPNGKYSESLDEYKKVNFDWFSDNDWSIEYEIIDKTVNKETGIALAKITYFDKDEKGQPYSFQYFLTLVFKVIEQEWKLVFDQNTIIK